MSTSVSNPTSRTTNLEPITSNAFDLSINKLKASSSKDLCKKVLVINSMDNMMDQTVMSRAQLMTSKFRSKKEWRKYLFDEFVNQEEVEKFQLNTCFKVINKPAYTIDSLSLLFDCLQITHKRNGNTNKVNTAPSRSVKNRTIGKDRRPKSFKNSGKRICN
ncbi:hypothetical protein K502DRAFT_340402 [Neoconidiobolus thromboides FSU 785]|nr:hypothetical protein K502DRAFT_340402 [Neoconidiobolus thromboides FSU 785]